AGLTEYLNVPAFVYIDFDLDGDLDIIATRVGASPVVFRNGTQTPALQLELNDARGNRRGVGAKVLLNSGELSQFRELKLSGGYLSLELPLAHFGLGAYDGADSLLVVWPDGGE